MAEAMRKAIFCGIIALVSAVFFLVDHAASAQAPEPAQAIQTAELCVQSLSIGAGRDVPSATSARAAQTWQRIASAMRATDLERQEAKEKAGETLAASPTGKDGVNLAAVGFTAVCLNEDTQTGMLLEHADPALKSEVGLIDAAICVAAAEYLVANDPRNAQSGAKFGMAWGRVLEAVNADASKRQAALDKARSDLLVAQQLSGGNELYVAQVTLKEMCAGENVVQQYLLRWGALESSGGGADGEGR